MTDLMTTRRALLGGLALTAVPSPIYRKPTPMTMSLEDLEAATERAAAAYMSGTADLQALEQHVKTLLHTASEHTGRARLSGAMHVQAWQAALLGALAAGQGHIPRAKAFALMVRQWGERAGDAQAVSRAHIAAAQVELWPGGDPANAVRLAAEGLHRTSPQRRESYARLCALLMEGHAKTGDRAAFAESMTLARKAHVHLDNRPSTLFGFSSQQMHQSLATALADTGDKAAVGYAELSIIRCPNDAPAVRTLADYPKAYALAKTGSPDDAVGVALASITSSPDAWFQRDRSRWVLQALPQGYDSPERRHLADLVAGH